LKSIAPFADIAENSFTLIYEFNNYLALSGIILVFATPSSTHNIDVLIH